MLDLELAPELPGRTEPDIDAAGDDMFVKLHRELQLAKIKTLTAYFARTATSVARQTVTASGTVLLHLSKCWNKPEEHDGGNPCAGVLADGRHFFRCQHRTARG